MIFIIDKDGNPLMPTNRHGYIRKSLKNGNAKIIQHNPFTVQLLKDTSNITQPLNLGIDAGSQIVGYSVTSDHKELMGGELTLRNDIKSLIDTKAANRCNRRNRLRHRKPRFKNRTRYDGWLAPSILHKNNSHIKMVDKVCQVLPISNIIVETANFDIQRIKNPDISGTEYQNGPLKDYNLREYILHRDGHECQNPNCKNKDTKPILRIHHIIYQDMGGTDTPDNLITLCTKCHTSKNHKKGGFLYEWMINKKKVKGFKDATFMSTVRYKILNELNDRYPDKVVKNTYGYKTKSIRIDNKIEKSHHNDAFVISGGISQKRCEPLNFNIIRRNDRCLETWKDASYIDSRTGEIMKGSQLTSGRTSRSTNDCINERIYRIPILKDDKNGVSRRDETTKGKRIYSNNKYRFSKGTICKVVEDWSNKSGSLCVKKGQIIKALGVFNQGKYVYVARKEYVPSNVLKEVYIQKGIVIK